MKVIGLMSGTSLDGIDAALVEFRPGDAAAARPDWELLAFRTTPYPDEVRRRIRTVIRDGGVDRIAALHVELGGRFADAALSVCEEAGTTLDQVDLIGSHGQTVWHDPPTAERRGVTFQIGDAATLAERTGVPVVGDFRSRDVAAGGHGAPLAPLADALLFASPDASRAIQNIGGMGNVTWVPAASGPVRTQEVFAFDTGPGMALIDEAVRRHSDGSDTFDPDGRIAASGTVRDGWLDRWMEDPFFREPPPRSTGRERFGTAWMDRVWSEVGADSPGDVEERPGVDLVATLTAFTVRSIEEAYRHWVIPKGVDEVVVVGGGAHNRTLVEGLRTALAPLPVRVGDEVGVPVDAREAIAFALLAWAYDRGMAGSLPGATGARYPRVLGSYTPGAGEEGRGG